MWDLIVSVPDHCLSFYFLNIHRGHFVKSPKVWLGACTYGLYRFCTDRKHISGLITSKVQFVAVLSLLIR